MIRNDGKYTVADFEFSINNDSVFQLQLYDLGIIYVSKLFNAPQIKVISHPNFGYTIIDKTSFKEQKSYIQGELFHDKNYLKSIQKRTKEIMLNVASSLYSRKLPDRDSVGLMMAMTSFNWLFKITSIQNNVIELLGSHPHDRSQLLIAPFLKPGVIPHYILWEIASEIYLRRINSKKSLEVFQYLYDCLRNFNSRPDSLKATYSNLKEFAAMQSEGDKHFTISEASADALSTLNSRAESLYKISQLDCLSKQIRDRISVLLMLCGLIVDEEEVRHIFQMRLQFLLYKKLGKEKPSTLYGLEMITEWNGMIQKLQL